MHVLGPVDSAEGFSARGGAPEAGPDVVAREFPAPGMASTGADLPVGAEGVDPRDDPSPSRVRGAPGTAVGRVAGRGNMVHRFDPSGSAWAGRCRGAPVSPPGPD